MTDTFQRIIDILQPIADQDWHGKWRIKKVLDLCSNKHPADFSNDRTKRKCEMRQRELQRALGSPIRYTDGSMSREYEEQPSPNYAGSDMSEGSAGKAASTGTIVKAKDGDCKGYATQNLEEK